MTMTKKARAKVLAQLREAWERNAALEKENTEMRKVLKKLRVAPARETWKRADEEAK